jgi:hypothetical protein
MVAAVVLALVSVADAVRLKGTLQTPEGSASVVLKGKLIGTGSRFQGRWHCRGDACPIRGAKIRLKCLVNSQGVPNGTAGVLWTGRRNKPRYLWQLNNPRTCTPLFPEAQLTLFLANGRQAQLSVQRGSPSGAFLE